MAIGQLMSLSLLCISLVFSLQNLFSQNDSISTQLPINPSPIISARLNSSSYTSLSYSHGSGYAPAIAPVIPGFNFPMEYVCEFWLVTFCVIVVHEFGHAAAASLERLQIQGCGTFFLFLFPGKEVNCSDIAKILQLR